MHKAINEINKRKLSGSSSGCIKAKNGDMLLTKAEVLERWLEYTKERFEDNRSAVPQIRKSLDGPRILASEVNQAISKMKRNKACGPDQITAEMLQATIDFSTEVLTEVINEI